MSFRVLMAIGLMILMPACTTKIGTNIVTDRIISPADKIERLGPVSASVSTGRMLWATPADRTLYEEVRTQALKLRDGNLLVDAKIITVLTCYLGLYYRTMLKIDGTAARVAESRQGENAER
ncbi:MAG TPA: hypothetical protein VJ692_07730 [Nitrospiraceae bacterium]|nr:hypothetical protein [Nitrospiraceae bacterium]